MAERTATDRASWGADDGTAVVETVLLVPVLMLVFLVAVFVGRLEGARLNVESAASSAARSASLARSPSAARAAASAEVTRALASARVSCPHSQVAVDTARFRPGGVVSVSLTCRADLGDLAGVGFLPVNTKITHTSRSPVDRYRQVETGADR